MDPKAWNGPLFKIATNHSEMMTHLSLSFFLPLFCLISCNNINQTLSYSFFLLRLSLAYLFLLVQSFYFSILSAEKKIIKTLQRWCYRQWEWRRCKFWNIYIWISRLWSIYKNKRIWYRTRQGHHYILNVAVVLFIYQ